MANVKEEDKDKQDKKDSRFQEFRKDFRAMRHKMKASIKETFSSKDSPNHPVIPDEAELLNSIYDYYPSLDLDNPSYYDIPSQSGHLLDHLKHKA